MKNTNYAAVTSMTFVNTTTRNAFWTIRLAVHNRPTVTTMFGALGTAGQKRVKSFESREEAREYVAAKIDEKLGRFYVQVA